MRLKRIKTRVTLLACAATIVSTALLGCSVLQQEKQDEVPDFSAAQHICELSTLDVYYHNVARAKQDASGPFGWFFNNGYKRMWFEYSGIVEFGIDFTKVSISKPSDSNTVTISLPQAEITDVKIDEDTITEPVIETGFMTSFSTEEKTEALRNAQQDMREAAEQDESLKFQARERARDMLESYVTNMGELIGEKYTVVWVDA